MSKVWKCEFNSFKRHPSGGTASQIVFVKGKTKTEVEAVDGPAIAELKYWDSEHFADYKKPKTEQVKENGEQALIEYLATKEEAGQTEIPSTFVTFSDSMATKSELPLIGNYALWIALTTAEEESMFIASFEVVDRGNDNETLAGNINNFLPYAFSTIGNAVSYAALTAFDAISAKMPKHEHIGVMEKTIKDFAKDPESNFVEHYVSEFELTDGLILTPSDYYDEPLSFPVFNAEHLDVREAVSLCVARYKGCQSPAPEECYHSLMRVLTPGFDSYRLCAAIMLQKNPNVLTNSTTSVNFVAPFLQDETKKKVEDAKASKNLPFNNDDEWQRFVYQILANTNEQDEIEPEDYAEIASKLNSVFGEHEIELIGADGYYTIPASELISHTTKTETILGELLNLRKLRALIADVVAATEPEPEPEPELKGKKKTETFPVVNSTDMFMPFDHVDSSIRVLSIGIGNSINAHLAINKIKFNTGGETNEFLGMVEQSGVFYAFEESAFEPDAFANADDAVMGSIEEIGKLIDEKFPNALNAINTIKVWKETPVDSAWFAKCSTHYGLPEGNEKADQPTEQETTNESSAQSNPNDNSANASDDFGVNGKTVSEIEPQLDQVNENANAQNSDDRNTHGDSERDSGDNSGTGVCGDTETPGNLVDLEQEISELEKQWDQDETSQKNMDIWKSAFKTDPKYTKPDTTGNNTTSINAQYRQMQATRLFGPRGKGWGVDVKREWIEDGMPIFVNGSPIGLCESVHNIEIDFWYIDPSDGQKYTITSVYGETERWYWSFNYSRLIKNSDVRKKSLTDATGKALSMLGICGDVYMGEYDDAHIETLNKNVVEAEKKVRHLEEEEKIRKEVNDKVAELVEEMQTTTTKAGVNTLRAKGLHIITALPDISDEQKRKKSKVIQKLEVRYNERLAEIVAEQERKKADKADKEEQAKAERHKKELESILEPRHEEQDSETEE